MIRSIVLLGFSFLFSCGGGSGSNGSSTKQVTALAQVVASAIEGTTLELNGAQSSTNSASQLVFKWEQLTGPSVDIQSASSSIAQFVAPQVSVDTSLSFQLSVTVDEVVSISEVEVLIEDSVAGRAVLGALINATVEVFDVTNPAATPIAITTTQDNAEVSLAGGFVLPKNLLQDDNLYVIRVRGGEDIDVNDDGIRDATTTPFLGVIRAIASGKDFLQDRFVVNALSEVSYQNVANFVASGYSNSFVLEQLDITAARQIAMDVNGDDEVTRLDVMRFDPRIHQDFYRRGVEWQDFSGQTFKQPLATSFHS